MEKVVRQSNMELLRIVSMLFVLVLHANFLGVHAPSQEDLTVSPVSTFFRCFIEALTIVAVNVFVLISGWFGIHFSFKKLGALCFQVLFFTLGFFMVFAVINPSEAFTVDKIKGIFLFNGDYWFVKAYIALFLLSPVLNMFVEHATKKQFQTVLISYYVFHTFYGWLMDASVNFTMNGTTALSFIGLYMLGRNMRLYPCRLTLKKKEFDLVVYLGCTLTLAFCNLFLLHRGYSISVEGRLYSYASPIVIVSSVYFLLFFSKFTFSSKTVNWIASSCFAVYLFHCNGFFISRYYCQFIHQTYSNLRINVFIILVYIIALYLFAVLLDKIRKKIWISLFNKQTSVG